MTWPELFYKIFSEGRIGTWLLVALALLVICDGMRFLFNAIGKFGSKKEKANDDK